MLRALPTNASAEAIIRALTPLHSGGNVAVRAGSDGEIGNLYARDADIAAGNGPLRGGDVTISAGDGGLHGSGGDMTIIGGTIKAGDAK